MPGNKAIKRVRVYPGKWAIVDAIDYDLVSHISWSVTSYGYAHGHKPGGKSGENIIMHRVILNAPKGVEVDHANGRGLDNRRCNIRLTDKTGNRRNTGKLQITGVTSRYKGVYRDGRKEYMSRRWRSRLTIARKPVEFGYYRTQREAALAYDEGARKYFGEFARTNFK